MESALGSLEREVLEKMWALGREVTVRELQESLGGSLAYTTLMTTMDRLFKKRLLGRRRDGRAFVYAPRITPDQLRQDVAADLIGSLLGRGRRGGAAGDVDVHRRRGGAGRQAPRRARGPDPPEAARAEAPMSFALWTICACLASFALAAGLASIGAWAAGRGVPEAATRDAGPRRAATVRAAGGADRRGPGRRGGAHAAGVPPVRAAGDGRSGRARLLRPRRRRIARHRPGAPPGRRRLVDDAPALPRMDARGAAPGARGHAGPAFRIRHSFPVVSVVGILRPRLFIAEQVLEHLSSAELRAVLAHEAAHVSAADNLKRLVVRLCPALPWNAAARSARGALGAGRRGGRRRAGRRGPRPGVGAREDGAPRPRGRAPRDAGGGVPPRRCAGAPREMPPGAAPDHPRSSPAAPIRRGGRGPGGGRRLRLAAHPPSRASSGRSARPPSLAPRAAELRALVVVRPSASHCASSQCRKEPR